MVLFKVIVYSFQDGCIVKLRIAAPYQVKDLEGSMSIGLTGNIGSSRNWEQLSLGRESDNLALVRISAHSCRFQGLSR